MTTATQALKKGATALTIAAGLLTVAPMASNDLFGTEISTVYAGGRGGATSDGDCGGCGPSTDGDGSDRDPKQCHINVVRSGNVLAGTMNYDGYKRQITMPLSVVGNIQNGQSFSYSHRDQDTRRSCQSSGSRAIEQQTWRYCADPVQSHLNGRSVVNLPRDGRPDNCTTTAPAPVATTPTTPRVTTTQEPVVTPWEATACLVAEDMRNHGDHMQDVDTGNKSWDQYMQGREGRIDRNNGGVLDRLIIGTPTDTHVARTVCEASDINATFPQEIKDDEGNVITHEPLLTTYESQLIETGRAIAVIHYGTENVCFAFAESQVNAENPFKAPELTDEHHRFAETGTGCPTQRPVEPVDCDVCHTDSSAAFNNATTPTTNASMFGGKTLGLGGLALGATLLAGIGIGRRRKDKAPKAPAA